jgi:cobalt-zinc-cadmium resistance protein CzcA
MQAEDRVRRVRLEQETIHHETAFDYYVLGQLLGLEEPVEPIIEPFHRPEYRLADTARLQLSTRTQMAAAGVPLAKAQQDVAAVQGAAQFQAGLNAQYLANNKLFPGYQVGLALPLARKGIRQRTQAAGMAVEVAEAEYQQVLLEQHVELGHLLHEVEKYEILINYYESDGLKVAKELRRNASLQYQQAAMGYLELLQNTEAALHMEMDYLENLYSLNRTVLELENLLGIGDGRR